jgi:hypothetical protein
MTEPVIGSALVAILQDVIRLIDFLKAVLTVLVAWIAVRVVLHRELAERSLELNLGGGAGNAENFIKVAFGHPPSALIDLAGTALRDSAS